MLVNVASYLPTPTFAAGYFGPRFASARSLCWPLDGSLRFCLLIDQDVGVGVGVGHECFLLFALLGLEFEVLRNNNGLEYR
jgi:hypothetical protein